MTGRLRSRLAARAAAGSEVARLPGWKVIAFVAVHLPLVVMMKQASILGTLHGWGTLAIGAVMVLASRRIVTGAFVAVYIVGCEGLWRMTYAAVFWEFGKYAISAVLLLALVRHMRFKRLVMPLLYFSLLIPSAFFTVSQLGMSHSKAALSFNLSGPFALAVSCLYFYQVRLTLGDLRKLLVILTGPIVGLAFGCLFGIISAEQIVFSTESNFATSGGFGPNQVSSTLGLGMLAVFLVYSLGGSSGVERGFFLGILLFLAAMSALTFSRSGIYMGVGSILSGMVFLCRNRRTFAALAFGGAAVFAIGWFVIFPSLDRFTQGNLSRRFQETHFSHRDEIAWGDVLIWLNHPIGGVGPGLSRAARIRDLEIHALSHTEFTRLLSEHGSFGAVALGVLFVMACINLRNATGPLAKAVVLGFLTFSALFMLVSAMRLASPSLAFGITCAGFGPWRSAKRRRPGPIGAHGFTSGPVDFRRHGYGVPLVRPVNSRF